LFCRIKKGGAITDDPLSTTTLDKILIKRAAQAGLSDISWHDFRRTAADNLLDSGVDISTVARIFGHSNVETTARYDRRGERAKIKAAGLIVAA
jgi:site-specific recombinase XerD